MRREKLYGEHVLVVLPEKERDKLRSNTGTATGEFVRSWIERRVNHLSLYDLSRFSDTKNQVSVMFRVSKTQKIQLETAAERLHSMKARVLRAIVLLELENLPEQKTLFEQITQEKARFLGGQGDNYETLKQF